MRHHLRGHPALVEGQGLIKVPIHPALDFLTSPWDFLSVAWKPEEEVHTLNILRALTYCSHSRDEELDMLPI